MPADYWLQIGWTPTYEGRWRFKCELMPEKIKVKQPQQYEVIKKAMGNIPDEKWNTYTPLCGARFVPWAKGSSKVLELKVQDEYFAILADRMPTELDDEIKKVQYEWQVACGRTTAAQIRQHIPMALPKCHAVQGCMVPGISKFDFTQWKRDGCPTLMAAGWIALAKAIASNNAVKLERTITSCDDASIKHERNPDLKTAMQMSRGIKPTKPISNESIEV